MTRKLNAILQPYLVTSSAFCCAVPRSGMCKLYPTSAKKKPQYTINNNNKDKRHPRTGHEGPKGEQRYSSTLSLTSTLDGGLVVNATPRPLYPPGKTRYPLYRRLGGPQGRSGRVRKFLPPAWIPSPDRPARSESLYRLSYRGPSNISKLTESRCKVRTI